MGREDHLPCKHACTYNVVHAVIIYVVVIVVHVHLFVVVVIAVVDASIAWRYRIDFSFLSGEGPD